MPVLITGVAAQNIPGCNLGQIIPPGMKWASLEYTLV